LYVQHKNQEYYVQAFMAGTTVKILACMIFIVVYLMKNKVNKMVFVGDFIYIYFLNMGFEIYLLLRNLRHKNLR
jgi:F0F1-type ATP synthase assembly protein I